MYKKWAVFIESKLRRDKKCRSLVVCKDMQQTRGLLQALGEIGWKINIQSLRAEKEGFATVSTYPEKEYKGYGIHCLPPVVAAFILQGGSLNSLPSIVSRLRNENMSIVDSSIYELRENHVRVYTLQLECFLEEENEK